MTLYPTKLSYLFSAFWSCAILAFASILPIWVDNPPGWKGEGRLSFLSALFDEYLITRLSPPRCLAIAFIAATMGAILGRAHYWFIYERESDARS